ncbi:MAG TPA: family 16 glycoside hydrolase [Planctomycetota bacterium]|nr:family 16 glycoside hydrolase [Planctomycetota bacterium]
MLIAHLLATCALLAPPQAPPQAAPQAPPQAAPFRPLFNGTDLSGWADVNCAESTWTARDGMIVCSGKPTGLLRTDRMYENFVLELDWRHMVPGGNAGLFIWSDPIPALGVPFARAVEVQVMDGPNGSWYTTHGDIFPIWGARMTPIFENPNGGSRCLPNEERSKPAPEWNHYSVTCIDGTIRLEVNGKQVSGGDEISPRRGYIVLESEGTEAHFKNIFIRELPASSDLPSRADIALSATGLRPLYGGVDLSRWKAPEAGHWTANDWRLMSDGSGVPLSSAQAFHGCLVTLDARWSAAASAREGASADAASTTRPVGRTTISLSGGGGTELVLAPAPPGEWRRFAVHLRAGPDKSQSGLVGSGPFAMGPVVLTHTGAPMEFANILVREAPSHAAVTPVPRFDEWWKQRHGAMNKRAAAGPGRLLFIGDSITHAWENNGAQAWAQHFARRAAVNLGISGDRTQHVLWRLRHGNLGQLSPELAVLMIGTNNSGDDSPVMIADGMRTVVEELLAHPSQMQVLLLAIFPRGATPADPLRQTNEAANNLAEAWAATQPRVHFLDIGASFLDPTGNLSREVMPDLLHLTPAAYATWAAAIEPEVARLLGEG